MKIKRLITITSLATIFSIIKNTNYKPISLELISEGFNKPILIRPIPNNKSFIVVEQTGYIHLMESNGNRDRSRKPFLDIYDRVHQPIGYDERGLLGCTFDPNFISNHYFYVNYIDKKNTTTISRFKTNDNVGEPNSEKKILTIKQPYNNHNGGCMEFRDDGYLYISVGDGGAGGDPENRAQDLTVLFGKILRIDVSTIEPYTIPLDNPFYNLNTIESTNKQNILKEIWSYGLRNVWKFSFDAETQDMIMADVGQNKYEEISFEPKNSSGGINYGWNIYEGMECYNNNNLCGQIDSRMPVYTYDHSNNNRSITGGYVYRGKNIPYLQGRYIFGDYSSGNIWSIKINTTSNTYKLLYSHTIKNKLKINLSSFGEDHDNELFLVDYEGKIYKLVA